MADVDEQRSGLADAAGRAAFFPVLAIVPLFAGFVPVLFTKRRRGLPDFLAGTVVLYDDARS